MAADYGTSTVKKHDWGMFFLGILLVICSVIIMAWPGATLVTIALFAGFMLLFAAGADLATFFNIPSGSPGRGWIMANAIIDILLGAMFVAFPVATAQIIPWLAGAFIVAYGIIAIITSIGVRSLGSTWMLMLLNGILSIIIGILFFVDPTYFVIYLGLYVAMRGVLMCIYGIVAPRSLPYI